MKTTFSPRVHRPDRINAIREAIDILQQELADLEAIEHQARMERLVPALTTP